MKKMKVDIAGVVALNWLVAQIEDMRGKFEQGGVWYMDEACTVPYAPASNPLHGDAIIDRERISTLARNFFNNPDWWATTNPYIGQDDEDDIGCAGETRLIAAMRAFVAKYRGSVAEVPDEIADDAGNGIRVRRVGSSEEWETWYLIANLTDRWGEINHHDAENKPLDELESDPERLERLRAQMWDEISFIVQKGDHSVN